AMARRISSLKKVANPSAARGAKGKVPRGEARGYSETTNGQPAKRRGKREATKSLGNVASEKSAQAVHGEENPGSAVQDLIAARLPQASRGYEAKAAKAHRRGRGNVASAPIAANALTVEFVAGARHRASLGKKETTGRARARLAQSRGKNAEQAQIARRVPRA